VAFPPTDAWALGSGVAVTAFAEGTSSCSGKRKRDVHKGLFFVPTWWSCHASSTYPCSSSTNRQSLEKQYLQCKQLEQSAT